MIRGWWVVELPFGSSERVISLRTENDQEDGRTGPYGPRVSGEGVSYRHFGVDTRTLPLRNPEI